MVAAEPASELGRRDRRLLELQAVDRLAPGGHHQPGLDRREDLAHWDGVAMRDFAHHIACPFGHRVHSAAVQFVWRAGLSRRVP